MPNPGVRRFMKVYVEQGPENLCHLLLHFQGRLAGSWMGTGAARTEAAPIWDASAVERDLISHSTVPATGVSLVQNGK